MTDHEDELPELPAALIERLRRGDAVVPFVPAALTGQILAAAEAQFAARPERRTRRRWAGFGAVAAAAAVAVLAIRVQPAADPADIDGSGRVDVLDVYLLARGEAAGEPVADIDPRRLAERIVSLTAGEPAS